MAKRAVLEILRSRRAASEADGVDADWTVLRVVLDDDCAMRRRLLGLADDLEVVAPPSLREALSSAAERAARLYRKRPP